MPNVDLQAVVTSWVAQELEEYASCDGIGYWATPGPMVLAQQPLLAIMLIYGEEKVLLYTSWPPVEHDVRVTVDAALNMLGLAGGKPKPGG